MNDILLMLLAGVPWTLGVTLCAFATGVVLGFPLCALRMAKARGLAALGAAIVLTLRSIPPIVWLFFIFFGIGGGYVSLSPFVAATVGLGLITAAQMAEVYRGAFAAIPDGQYEAAHVLNLSSAQRFFDVVLPQLTRISIPTAATYAIGLLKDSAVASTLGVADISFQAYQVSQQTFQGLGVYSAAALVYLVLSVPVALASRWLSGTLQRRISL
ncbi:MULTISPECIES: amino acid ABC transporter permease [Pseudomonas]|jgi:polar amino acid transport system permease protein|uniref:amino acid ABC transporter permease n=1 Tax=Pseudomonas TaxID=286 RepID=UPI000D015A0B|nr:MULTISPECIES: amino acid ABC transporter permease [Pseudomonas]MBI6917412.1 amino acid ABC transporter permease [Pseudomonas monteilii]MCE0941018.1 amino acid ABC transporter permease [Pseudomonas kurunegalensis]MDR2318265.1 amino acid ABC transporter permease [Pseudomonas sp.]PRN01766.1 amino acid ABC transporter permease [Pseudomonas sp. LLC-1]PYG72289.1 amino acid ABC transporter membrane protein 1 (PAAT family) [Pseudomonas sp. RV120224-01c]